ncbi:hypothetical protein P879_07111 [Paragonimus westermani]|uniref:PDZ domain-containing protein n=1 Tax=Paragonimus westermani TaxID=34504 RepID=A0A8T0DJ48_9TREM|nr:hypothetical protein P879_07111 [Paragonimus westermani]
MCDWSANSLQYSCCYSESGLEVHHVMPDGRVAREGCLSVGDRILRINNVSLTGVPFEKSRDIFQKALSQPELVLDVFPCSARRKMQEVLEASSEKLPFITPRLIVVKDQNTKVKEVEAGAVHPAGKPAPPPPPRRSPSTVLSRPSNSPDTASSEENQSHTVTLVVTSCVGLLTTSNADSSLNCRNLSAEGYIPIYLQKGAVYCTLQGKNGLGFSLSSREDPANNGERIVCVKSILPGGAALIDGRLKPGDRLVQVSVKHIWLKDILSQPAASRQ